MIGFLKGKVLLTNNNSLILDVSDIGYLVTCTLPVLVSINKGDDLSLYIHTHVREDHISLYGFIDESELFVFEKLIQVSGIGPRSAMAMLSVNPPSSLAKAIEEGDSQSLSHTPGVGKKTAEKIILELKGKLIHLNKNIDNGEGNEAKMALEALGYSPKEIHEALKEIDTKNKNTNEIIKEALRQLH